VPGTGNRRKVNRNRNGLCPARLQDSPVEAVTVVPLYIDKGKTTTLTMEVKR
jgi:hypothetical protein